MSTIEVICRYPVTLKIETENFEYTVEYDSYYQRNINQILAKNKLTGIRYDVVPVSLRANCMYLLKLLQHRLPEEIQRSIS